MKLFFLLFSFLPFSSFLQEDTLIYDNPDTTAEFPGGQIEWMKWLTNQEMLHAEEFVDGTCSKIYFQFIVEKDGSITHEKSLNTCFLSQQMAVVLMQNCPTWRPAIHHSVKVRSRVTLPITICFSD
jgi:protein TonB